MGTSLAGREAWDLLGRWRVPSCILAGLLTAQAALLTRPEVGLLAVAALGARAALGCWALLTFLAVGDAMLRVTRLAGESMGHPERSEGSVSQGGKIATSVASDPRGQGTAWHTLGPAPVVGGAALLIAAFTFGSPGRMAVTLLCYLVLVTSLAWAVQRGAGRRAAGRAAAALSVVAVVGSATDVRLQPPIIEAQAASTYRWTVGWPTETWVLRHEIRPQPPLPVGAIVLHVPLANAYEGPAQVYARVNGHNLGPARLGERRSGLQVDVPGALVNGQARLLFELRLAPVDPRLRITAHRWGQAATAGPGASSYFDAERWWPGTFNDALGQARQGIYVVQVEPAS
ncbi:MAG: hypothetical protein M3442_12635 [Chloroflexota bacterium]|nr:hypothetical protein [Chloroflexota bacterium]